jgi:predicted ferric reductase
VTGQGADERHVPQPFPGLDGAPTGAPQYLPDPSAYAPYAPPVVAEPHVEAYAGHALAAPVAELPAPSAHAPAAPYAPPASYASPVPYPAPEPYAPPASYAEPVPYAPPASYAPTTYDPAAYAPPARPAVRPGVAARGRARGRGDVAVTAGGVGLGISLGIAVYSVKDGLDLPGGKLLALGTIAAMTGTYLCLVLLLLVARIPWIEREIGQDRLVALHRKVAPYSLFLIAGHVVLTTISYAQAEDHTVLGQLWALVTKSAWMVPAATAFVLMVGLGVVSYRKIRRRMRYETWWVAHLYFYLAVALAFGHQIELGVMFQAHPYQKYFWTALYLFVFGTILVTRFIIPISFSRKHQLRVAAVVPEGDGVVSVYISGVDLDLVKARGGQFFQWRFVTRDWWWQAHPYSLSASPNPSWLRITVKALGDQSSRLRRLRVGTRVLAEGPYGVFTAAARHGDSIAAFAAGVGITPIRAVLDDLPDGMSVTLVYRVTHRDTAPLREELEELVTARGWRMHYLQGSRHHHPLTAKYLSRLVPGLAASDVFVCGPTSFTDRIVESVRAAGVADEHVHHEAFSF